VHAKGRRQKRSESLRGVGHLVLPSDQIGVAMMAAAATRRCPIVKILTNAGIRPKPSSPNRDHSGVGARLKATVGKGLFLPG
jgi:hypothetical protein